MESLKVLIPTDFSVQAEYAYLMVKKLEEKIPVEIHFIHVLGVPDTVTMDKNGNIQTCGEISVDYVVSQKTIADREIEYLIHFTPTINLLSIFEQDKLLSRALLESFDIDQTDIFDYIEFTDEIRFDDKSYINLSIQYPNSFLFNRFREKTKNDLHINWCVLKIDKKYIYQKDTLFSVTNAANSYNKRNIGVTGDIDKFRKLYENSLQIVTSYNSRTITRNNLKSKYPTDEQAEVLIKNQIPVSDILQICFKDDTDLAAGKAALNDYDTSNFVVDSTLFNNKRN
jgi:hypothetical protein